MNKFWKVLESTNFRTNLITVFLSAFALNGANIPPDTAGELVTTFDAGNWGLLLTMLFINVINPIIKIFKNKVDDFWSFLRSKNFWINVITLVLSIFILNGVEIPAGTPTDVAMEVWNKNWFGLITLIGVNIFNPIYHFFKKKPSL